MMRASALGACLALGIGLAAGPLACSNDNQAGGDDQDADAGCPASKPKLAYTEPGCGSEAKPVCVYASQDACAAPRCGCSGEEILACDYSDKPFRSFGPCP